MTALKPCRFCGETEHLQIHPALDEDWTFNEDGSVKRAESGAFLVVSLDFVGCSICNAQAPIEIWNRPDGQWAMMRTATLAGWDLHDVAKKLVMDALEATTGRSVDHLLESWDKVSPRVPADQFVVVLEKQLGLSPAPLEYGGTVDGVVNHFAGRVTA